MEALEQLIDKRVEKALAELRESPEFMSELTAQRDTLDSLLAQIPDEEIRKAVTTYIECDNDIGGIQLKAAYKAGTLDAVKLLKTLGVI
jgi:hypothetical protein